ncbi:MAG: class I SAM-dependent methyltransferase [Planctomycetota bacterium]
MPSPLLRFSKPSQDVAPEAAALSADETRRAAEQGASRRRLPNGMPRTTCLLCGASTTAAQRFRHADVDYLSCSQCTHIQSVDTVEAHTAFSTVYPALDDKDHLHRCLRIYKPKLDWILESLLTLGIERSKALALQWLEIGCGTGGFVRALEREGASTIVGFDRDEGVLQEARRHVRSSLQTWDTSPSGKMFPPLDADILAAFFVLEHVDSLALAAAELKASKTAYLALSVPCFGLGAALEGLAPGVFTRNLDGVIHRQMFTEKSLEQFLNLAGYECAAQWTFGQDALDLKRVVSSSPALAATPALRETFTKALTPAIDRLQSIIDIAGLADSVHVLARKKL